MYDGIIDWSKFGEVSQTCYCRCGAIFRSHAKFVGSVLKMVTKSSCPVCNQNDDCYRVSSDPEQMIVKVP